MIENFSIVGHLFAGNVAQNRDKIYVVISFNTVWHWFAATKVCQL